MSCFYWEIYCLSIRNFAEFQAIWERNVLIEFNWNISLPNCLLRIYIIIIEWTIWEWDLWRVTNFSGRVSREQLWSFSNCGSAILHCVKVLQKYPFIKKLEEIINYYYAYACWLVVIGFPQKHRVYAWVSLCSYLWWGCGVDFQGPGQSGLTYEVAPYSGDVWQFRKEKLDFYNYFAHSHREIQSL